MFEDERELLRRVERHEDPSNQRDVLSEKDIESIRSEYPNVPEDYLAYMREIGWGSAREDQYSIHQGLSWCHEEPLFNWFDTHGRRLLVFGANSMGDLWAFDADNQLSVCELLHESNSVLPFSGTFKAFIREAMLLSEEGKDERES